MTAASLNDLAQACVMSVGVYPAIWECWPLGERLCQIQVSAPPSLHKVPLKPNGAHSFFSALARRL